jgi:hypothetical protein
MTLPYCTAQDVYDRTGLSNTEVLSSIVTTFCQYADEEINQTTKQHWDDANVSTEYFNVYPPKRADDIEPNRILLGHYPVLSLSQVLMLDSAGTASTTLSSITAASISSGTTITTDYFVDPTTGLIELTSRAFEFVPRKAKVVYTYGYFTVPTIVKEISVCLAGARAWANFLGGNFNRLNSYTVPEQSFSKGDFYARGAQMIETLNKKAEELFNQIGKKQRSAISFTSGGYF